MTHHNEGFLRSICENPEDDTPRLIYADWLEEEGDELRARFIRAQITLAQICPCDSEGKPKHDQDVLSWTGSMDNLWGDVFDWLKASYHCPLEDSPDGSVEIRMSAEDGQEKVVVYRRGFVDEMTVSWENWRDFYGPLTGQFYPVRQVTLIRLPDLPDLESVTLTEAGQFEIRAEVLNPWPGIRFCATRHALLQLPHLAHHLLEIKSTADQFREQWARRASALLMNQRTRRVVGMMSEGYVDHQPLVGLTDPGQTIITEADSR